MAFLFNWNNNQKYLEGIENEIISKSDLSNEFIKHFLQLFNLLKKGATSKEITEDWYVKLIHVFNDQIN
jgi:hypothetical protein